MTHSIENIVPLQEVTILYYGEDSLQLLYSFERFPQMETGRVKISDSFKQGKSIVAVCKGRIDILNGFGERIEFNASCCQTNG